MKIAIIGAGMAGMSCAMALQASDHEVRLFDKGRGAGGRMSTRRVKTALGETGLDHGAPSFVAETAEFEQQCAMWHRRGLLAPWPAAGAEAWVGHPSMNAPLKAMAAELDVRWSSLITGLVSDSQSPDGRWRLQGLPEDSSAWDAVVVATPAEQAAPLLGPWESDFAQAAADVRSLPCWTVMLTFAAPLPLPASVALGDKAVIATAMRNTAKPGRPAIESWVIQASAAWSVAHLEETPEKICAAIRAELSGTVPDLPEILSESAHRWRFAQPDGTARPLTQPDQIWNGESQIGICGDWVLGSTVEHAWLSGVQLAQQIIAQP